MEKEIIFLVEEAAEGGYQARALGHAIFTESDNFEELKRMAQDAVQCHFEPKEMPLTVKHYTLPLALRGSGQAGKGTFILLPVPSLNYPSRNS